MIRTTRRGPVVELVLDRPRAGNALDRDGVGRLRAEVDALDDDVELILVRGGGPRAFCGGIDSREIVALGPRERRAALAAFADCCEALWWHPALSVATLGGYAIGGGAHLAMACDLRVIATDAWMQFPSSRYGLNLTVTWLALAVGPAGAAALLAGARRIGADDALRLGLATAVAAPAEAQRALGLDDATGLRELKAAVRATLPPHVGAALDVEKARALDLVGGERFVTALRSEASVR